MLSSLPEWTVSCTRRHQEFCGSKQTPFVTNQVARKNRNKRNRKNIEFVLMDSFWFNPRSGGSGALVPGRYVVRTLYGGGGMWFSYHLAPALDYWIRSALASLSCSVLLRLSANQVHPSGSRLIAELWLTAAPRSTLNLLQAFLSACPSSRRQPRRSHSRPLLYKSAGEKPTACYIFVQAWRWLRRSACFT